MYFSFHASPQALCWESSRTSEEGLPAELYQRVYTSKLLVQPTATLTRPLKRQFVLCPAKVHHGIVYQEGKKNAAQEEPEGTLNPRDKNLE